MPPRKKKQQKQSLLPLYLIIAGAVIIIGVMVWAAISGRSSGATNNAGIPAPEIERVTLADAKAAYDAGSAIFLDVRAKESYGASHVTNAVNIPLGDIETRMGDLDKTRWIIPYCT